MKRNLLLFCSIMLSANLFAQKMPSDYFEEGTQYVGEKDYPKAVEAFRYIVENHKKNELYPESFYNLAYTYYLQKDLSQATPLFRAILSSDFYERKEIGGNIMSSPYANFRHRASSILSNIYYDEKKYDSSLYYLGLSDSVFQYQHFCGNAYAEQDVYLSLRYADLYQKLEQNKKAAGALLKAVFIEDLADNSKVLQELMGLLKKQNKRRWKAVLDQAIANLYAKTSAGDQAYYFNFQGHEVKAPSIWRKEKPSKKDVIERIKSSSFYKELSKM